jgi:hypothetical protein
LDVTGTVCAIQEQELCCDDVGYFVSDGVSQENDAVHHQPAVHIHNRNIHWAFLYDIRSQVGNHVIGISMKGIAGNSPVLYRKFFEFLTKVHDDQDFV